MDSSLCVIETPQKTFISVKTSKTKVSSKHSDRFSPSSSLLHLMDNVARVHSFQFHIEVSLIELSSLNFLSRKLTKSLEDFFKNEDPDIPDVIIQLETIALTDGYYGPFLKEYVSEEFSVPPDYSFCVVAILNYMEFFKISVEEALCDIFQVFSRKPLNLVEHQERNFYTSLCLCVQPKS